MPLKSRKDYEAARRSVLAICRRRLGMLEATPVLRLTLTLALAVVEVENVATPILASADTSGAVTLEAAPNGRKGVISTGEMVN